VSDIRPEWLEAAHRVGVTAGASTPEVLVSQTVEALRQHGVTVREVHVVEEDVRFALPQELDEMARERGLTLPARTAMRQSI
jgi:4-hydroxy-3-methylbut-2-en-1-yl diphosphate reductase